MAHPSISLFVGPPTVVEVAEDLTSLILGLAFLNSSIRLTVQRRRPRA